MHRLSRSNESRISDQVLEQLRELIFRSEFKPVALSARTGTGRGPQGQLHFCSRSIGKSVAMGLLEQHQGQGTFVRVPEPTANTLWRLPWRPRTQAWKTFWRCEWVSSAMPLHWRPCGAEESDLQFLEKSLDEMRKEVQAGRLGTEADVAFHMAVTYATKTPLQVLSDAVLLRLISLWASRKIWPTSTKNRPTSKNHFTAYGCFVPIRDYDPRKASAPCSATSISCSTFS